MGNTSALLFTGPPAHLVLGCGPALERRAGCSPEGPTAAPLHSPPPPPPFLLQMQAQFDQLGMTPDQFLSKVCVGRKGRLRGTWAGRCKRKQRARTCSLPGLLRRRAGNKTAVVQPLPADSRSTKPIERGQQTWVLPRHHLCPFLPPLPPPQVMADPDLASMMTNPKVSPRAGASCLTALTPLSSPLRCPLLCSLAGQHIAVNSSSCGRPCCCVNPAALPAWQPMPCAGHGRHRRVHQEPDGHLPVPERRAGTACTACAAVEAVGAVGAALNACVGGSCRPCHVRHCTPHA